MKFHVWNWFSESWQGSSHEKMSPEQCSAIRNQNKNETANKKRAGFVWVRGVLVQNGCPDKAGSESARDQSNQPKNHVCEPGRMQVTVVVSAHQTFIAVPPIVFADKAGDLKDKDDGGQNKNNDPLNRFQFCKRHCRKKKCVCWVFLYKCLFWPHKKQKVQKSIFVFENREKNLQIFICQCLRSCVCTA